MTGFNEFATAIHRIFTIQNYSLYLFRTVPINRLKQPPDRLIQGLKIEGQTYQDADWGIDIRPTDLLTKGPNKGPIKCMTNQPRNQLTRLTDKGTNRLRDWPTEGQTDRPSHVYACGRGREGILACVCANVLLVCTSLAILTNSPSLPQLCHCSFHMTCQL